MARSLFEKTVLFELDQRMKNTTTTLARWKKLLGGTLFLWTPPRV
jgi:hypothetical protein